MLRAGDIIDSKYRVVRLIGEGGMGAVYEGQNLAINRRIAIKVMHASIARDRDLIARFEREAHAAAKIGSRFIADVLDLGDLPNGDRFMIMEYFVGETLHARLKRQRRLPPQEIAPIGLQLLEGLAKVHDAGIVHRDLKPSNIFLARDEGSGRESVKILDFGICKMTRDNKKNDLSTGIGDLLGTLPYMCPEQLEHGTKKLDGRADIYSVGVMLYRCVTGQLPYRASNLLELLMQLREGRAPAVCDLAPDVDKRFGAIIDKAIEWDPKARYATARDFQKAIAVWMNDKARVERLLSDFLDSPRSAQRRTAQAPASDERELETPAMPIRRPRASADPRSQTHRRRRAAPAAASAAQPPARDAAPTIPDDGTRRLPSIEIEIDFDADPDDEAKTIPRHSKK